MDSQLFIPVVLGSVRSKRLSLRAAHLIHDRILAEGHRGQLVDLRRLDLPLYGMDERGEEHPAALEFRGVMEAADAVVFQTPEYNHGYTAAIKNAVDYLHTEIRRKPVAVCGLSGGALGGARGVEQLKLVLIELHAVPIRDSVYFSDARGIWDQDGTLLRPEVERRVDEMLAELAWYARALKWGREHVPLPVRRRS